MELLDGIRYVPTICGLRVLLTVGMAIVRFGRFDDGILCVFLVAVMIASVDAFLMRCWSDYRERSEM